MSQGANIQLFTLRVFHSWFDKDVCRCLRFNPDAPTSAIFRQYGFLQNNLLNGFDLYSKSNNTSLQGLFQYITTVTGQSAFTFAIVSSRDDFEVLSEYPVDSLSQLSFNSEACTGPDGNGVLLLSTEFLPSSGTSAVGNLTIRFADLITYRSGENVPAFQMKLNARSTQWQYYIIPGRSGAPDNPGITGKDGIQFSGPESVTTESGQEALLFSSGNVLLPLSETPRYKLDLVSNAMAGNFPNGPNRSNSKTLFKGLPNPGTEFLSATSAAGSSQVISPMYVYL